MVQIAESPFYVVTHLLSVMMQVSRWNVPLPCGYSPFISFLQTSSRLGKDRMPLLVVQTGPFLIATPRSVRGVIKDLILSIVDNYRTNWLRLDSPLILTML